MNKRGGKTRVKPIKDIQSIKAMAAYLKQSDNERGQSAYIVWLLCVNCGLRVSDALELRIANICGQGKRVKETITIVERKTGKLRYLVIGNNVRKELQNYIDGICWRNGIKFQSYLFPSPRKDGKHIGYKWMYGRIKEAAAACHIGENSATHIMRKTFARQWYEQNLPRYGNSVTKCAEALQENILHHRRLDTTLRYIDAEEEYLKETCKGIDITV